MMRRMIVSATAVALFVAPVGAVLAVHSWPAGPADGPNVVVAPADAGAVGGLNVLEPAVTPTTAAAPADAERALRDWTATKGRPSRGG
jgi:hypothetical protein